CECAARGLVLRYPYRESTRLHADRRRSFDRSRCHCARNLARYTASTRECSPRAEGRLCAAISVRQRAELRSTAMAGSSWALLLLLAVLAKPVQAQDNDTIARGEYLARAGDCVACHTAPEGPLFAGSRAMPTPFGTIYSTNITPDRETGIGKWSADDFYRTMHNGRFPDGGLIYPAMPFASYTKVTRADCDAIFAYLNSIPPVSQRNRPNDLRFPYNNRQLLLGWRTLFFTEGEYKNDATKSAEWNRGAYLVEGLGHCGMCHSPINALGGTSESEAFRGGLIAMENWVVPGPGADLEPRSGARRLEHEGHRRSPEDRNLDARRGVRSHGGSRPQQPAISHR